MERREPVMCSRCVMDTSDPEISFDDRGVCNHCRHYDAVESMYNTYYGPNFVKRGEKLEKFIKKIKEDGRKKEYDCIIGISGGVDSTYVALLMDQFRLRALAVHLDNGWDTDVTRNNIKKIGEKLDIDIHHELLEWNEFCDLQLAFLRSSTPDSEIPTDHAIDETMYRSTKKYSIRYNINGYNFKTESHLPTMWSTGHADWVYIKGIHERFGSVPLKTFPHYTPFTYLVRKYSKSFQILFSVPRQLNILNFLEFNKKNIITRLKEEIGYEYSGGKHNESVYTRFYQGYILPRKFGYDKRRCHLSSLICAGQLTRDEAIRELEDPPYPVEQQVKDRNFVLGKLGISDEDFTGIMSLPKKTYRNYPHSALFDRGAMKYLRFLSELTKK